MPGNHQASGRLSEMMPEAGCCQEQCALPTGVMLLQQSTAYDAAAVLKRPFDAVGWMGGRGKKRERRGEG